MSNYREMAPSMLPEDSTPSSPGKFAEDGPTTSGDAGGLGGDGHPGTSKDAGEGSGNGGDSSKNRKRRPAGSVSVMACTPCRQARQKVSRK